MIAVDASPAIRMHAFTREPFFRRSYEQAAHRRRVVDASIARRDVAMVGYGAHLLYRRCRNAYAATIERHKGRTCAPPSHFSPWQDSRLWATLVFTTCLSGGTMYRQAPMRAVPEKPPETAGLLDDEKDEMARRSVSRSDGP